MTWLRLAALALASWTSIPLPFHLTSGETAKKPLPATMGGGIAVFDFDGDGKLDLFFPNGGVLPNGPKASDKLLRNLGHLRFEDVTARASLSGRDYDIAAAVADYDADGLPDLLVCGLKSVTLYRNLGQGRFADVTAASGIDNRGRWSVGAVWFDMDNDGDLDLFILNYVRWDPANERTCIVNGKPDFCHPKFYDPRPNAMFRNEGNGRFRDISVESNIDKFKGKGMGVAAADFDNDGFTDLYVTNDRTFAFLFHNRGNGTFDETAFDAGVAVPQDGNPVSGMGVDAQDFDNDGRPDIVYTALRDETFPLYRNKGRDFEEVTALSGFAVLSRPMSGWGIAFADLDNDGWKDIVAARSDALSITGGRGAAAKEPPAWFRNSAQGKWLRQTAWDSLEAAMYRGIVPADLDNDGCLDIVLTALNAPARILRNPCADSKHNWFGVALPNPGARVRVNNQWREVSSAIGYASSYWGPLHFGLGAETAAAIEVIWPGGKKTSAQSPANRTITLKP